MGAGLRLGAALIALLASGCSLSVTPCTVDIDCPAGNACADGACQKLCGPFDGGGCDLGQTCPSQAAFLCPDLGGSSCGQQTCTDSL